MASRRWCRAGTDRALVTANLVPALKGSGHAPAVAVPAAAVSPHGLPVRGLAAGLARRAG